MAVTLPAIHRESPVFAQALGLRCESAGRRTKAGRTSALTLSTALTEMTGSRIYIGFTNASDVDLHVARTFANHPCKVRILAIIPAEKKHLKAVQSELAYWAFGDGWFDLSAEVLARLALDSWLAGTYDIGKPELPAWVERMAKR